LRRFTKRNDKTDNDISSDVFGYPEAYYNPPLEAVETIELIRGGASLQFGPQFGGMLNYVLKKRNQEKFSFETKTASVVTV
jgi:Fe(3+) dicitrate transport protein